jgi:hypothetical protein
MVDHGHGDDDLRTSPWSTMAMAITSHRDDDDDLRASPWSIMAIAMTT